MHTNRLGELLVLGGSLSQTQLQHALVASKSSGKPLGRFLTDERIIERKIIRQALIEQFMLRMMMAVLTLFVSFAGVGGVKQARAVSEIVRVRRKTIHVPDRLYEMDIDVRAFRCGIEHILRSERDGQFEIPSGIFTRIADEPDGFRRERHRQQRSLHR